MSNKEKTEGLGIKETFDVLLVDAIKANDTKTKNFIRQMRAKVSEHCLANNLPRDSADQDIWLKVMSVYKKSIAKALELMERRGAGDSELAEEYKFEVDFCNKYLPRPLGYDEVLGLVKQAVSDIGPNAKVGQVVGVVVNGSVPGTVDAVLAKRAATEILG